jgi:hypothetical protein
MKLALFKRPIFRIALLGIAVVGINGGFFAVLALTEPKAGPAAKPATGAQMPTNPAIEERWGIRVKQIGVSADGGLVDFRFVVVDPDKALTMMTDEKNLPVLVTEDNGKLVNSAALMPSKHALTPGQTYFLLYRNAQGAIKHDSSVTVVFGDLKLEHAGVL